MLDFIVTLKKLGLMPNTIKIKQPTLAGSYAPEFTSDGSKQELPKDANILSTTLPSNCHITYVNPDFIKISGFTEEELLGQPHNIVRHPDMPPAAFEHMWSTLKSGRSWMGLVKIAVKMATTIGKWCRFM